MILCYRCTVCFILINIQPESDCTQLQNEVVQSSSPQSDAGQSSQQATPTAARNQPRVPVQTRLEFSPTGLTLNRELLGVEVSSECMCTLPMCGRNGEALWLCKLPILVWL